MTKPQRTLSRAVEIEGTGLFSGKPVKLRCLPAPVGSGISFVRTDLPGSSAVRGAIENIVPPDQSLARSTSVQKGETQVATIEHLMATCMGLGVDNLAIEIDGPEMPAGDGSALTYVEPFLSVGLEDLDAPSCRVRLEHPVHVAQDDVLLVMMPQEEGLTVTYVLDYGKDFFGAQALTVQLDQETFLRDIAPAKTYCLRPEIEFFWSRGLGKGATEENTIVVEPDGAVTGGSCTPEECVQHKILDLLGDLYLAGGAFTGRVFGYKSGHETNVRLARILSEFCN